MASMSKLHLLCSGLFCDFRIQSGDCLFRVHKAVISESKYFLRVCTSEFKEAQEGHLPLEESPELVLRVLVWLYGGNYLRQDSISSHGSIPNSILEAAKQQFRDAGLIPPSTNTSASKDATPIVKPRLPVDSVGAEAHRTLVLIRTDLDLALLANYLEIRPLMAAVASSATALMRLKSPLLAANSPDEFIGLIAHVLEKTAHKDELQHVMCRYVTESYRGSPQHRIDKLLGRREPLAKYLLEKMHDRARVLEESIEGRVQQKIEQMRVEKLKEAREKRAKSHAVTRRPSMRRPTARHVKAEWSEEPEA